MSRRTMMELRLVEIKFPLYNKEVSYSISEIMQRIGVNYEISDAVLSEILRCHTPEVEAIVNSLQCIGDNSEKLTHESIKSHVRQYYNDAIDYESELSDLPITQFISHYKSVLEAYEFEKSSKTDSEGKERDLLDFFNEPNAEINQGFWRGSTGWSAAEAVALSLGKDPSIVNEITLIPYRRPLHSPFRHEFERRLNLLNRALSVGELTLPLNRKSFAEWVIARGWMLDAKASMVITQRDKLEPQDQEISTDEFTLIDHDKPHVKLTALKRKYNKLLLLCFGLTHLNYRYNPFDKDTVNHKEIAEDLANVARLPISDETIASRLEEAFDILPISTKQYLEDLKKPK